MDERDKAMASQPGADEVPSGDPGPPPAEPPAPLSTPATAAPPVEWDPAPGAPATTPPVAWAPPSTIEITPAAWPPPDLPVGPQPLRPPTTRRRILDVVVWIVGLIAVLILSRTYVAESRTVTSAADAIAFVLGTAVVSLLFALVGWAVFVKLFHRSRFGSPWVAVIAVALVLMAISGTKGERLASEQATAAAPTPEPPASAASGATTAPIDTYLVIEPPFELEPALDSEIDSIAGSFGELGDRTEVRRITRDGIIEGFLVVVDAGARFPIGSVRLLEAGIKSEEGVETERTTLRGHEAIVATVTDENVTFVAWLESPHILLVYGVDPATSRDMSEAVIAAYE